MQKSRVQLLALSASLFLGAAAFAQEPTPLLTQPAAKLIEVLKSNAPQKDKADACRELAVVGGKNAVAPLAALLADEGLSHMARHGLETIPDPAVDDAFRAALGQLKGRLLAGVIGSIGVRHDAKAVDALQKLLLDADADVAQAAARSLGTIATPAAIKGLENVLSAAAPKTQLAICEGLFRCAESVAAKQPAEAIRLYGKLLAAPQAPHQVRAAAFRGNILADTKKQAQLVTQAFRGNDGILAAAAARAAIEIRGASLAKAIAAEWPKLSEDRQILAASTLGKMGESAALPPLFAAARSGSKPARLAAIRALPEIGGTSVASALAELICNADADIDKAAQESLAGLRGSAAESAVLKMLAEKDLKRRLAALDLIGMRRMTSAIPTLKNLTAEPDAKLRQAAWRKLGELGGEAELASLVALLGGAKGADLDALEQAVGSLSARSANPDVTVAGLVAVLPLSGPEPKCALLRVLTSVGGAKALTAVCAAVKDNTPEVHAEAIRALGDWKSVDAAPQLLALAKSPSTPADKLRCLRSYLRLAALPDLDGKKRQEMCTEAAGLVQRDDEKKMLLGALGNLASVESLRAAQQFLSDAVVKEEAAAAVVAVSDKLLQTRNPAGFAPRLIEPLNKVLQTTGNDGLKKRSQALLQTAQTKAAEKKK